MLKFYFNKRVLIGFILMLAILSWLAIYSYLNTRALISTSRWVAHTQDVLYNAERVLASSTDIELAQRGHTLTGNEVFIQSYEKASTRVGSHLQNLLSLTIDNESQLQRLNDLHNQIEELKKFSNQAIALRKNNFEAARELNEKMIGKVLIDSIRETIAIIQAEEQDLLKARTHANDFQIQKFNEAYIALVAVIITILITVFFAINVNLKACIDSEIQLKTALTEIKDLYNNAPCGYHSLDKDGVFVDVNDTLLKWLGYSRQEVLNKLSFASILSEESKEAFLQNFDVFKRKGSIGNLDFTFIRKDGTSFPVILGSIAIQDEEGNYIKSRSTTFDNTERKLAEDKIQLLNQELEAFTYSVSHDLRAPLRSIDGYAQILQEDYNDKLDHEGRRVLSIVMSNAKRMGKLIDDLLDFARLGRKDLTISKPNMTLLVNTIADELIEQEPDRDIAIVVHPLELSCVDIDMIRQVWINLLSNAIKYTSRNHNARIEISSIRLHDEVCYKIKDNGVGFDMQYVHKLFGVFQRLHRMEDFSGTGVGLAIVKRVIARHKGKVWADGKINEGAIFYFTIPYYHEHE